MKRIISSCIIVLCIFVFEDAEAAIFEVSNVTELQNALTAAQDNREDDTINLAPGTYIVGSKLSYFAGELENFSLAIQGTGAGGTILDGGNSTSILEIELGSLWDGSNANITIRGVTFRNGSESWNVGGAIYIGNCYALATIEDSVFQNNTSGYGGGALYLSGWSATIARNIFTGNSITGTDGGAVYVSLYGGSLTLDGNTFSNNSSAGGGAGIFTTVSGVTALTGNSFSGNTAGREGGGAYLDAGFGSLLTLSGNIFDANTASSGGGAFISSQSSPTVISDNIFSGNIASTSSESAGGGLAVVSQDSLEMINNLFTGNMTSQGGAGAMIDLFKNENQITNNTIVGNTSTGAYGEEGSVGGGMYVRTLANNTVANIYNNIIWGNSAAAPGENGSDFYINDDGSHDGVGSVINLYSNDFSNMKVLLRSNLHQGGNINEDPNLGPDYQLEPGSPCMDTGSNSAPHLPATDMAGNARVQDGKNSGTPIVDMGAYESGSNGFLVVTISPQGAVDAGARWRIDGRIWQVSGTTQKTPVGQYTVEFSDLSGWTKPANQTVTINNDKTATISGTYTAETVSGSVQVTISPQAAVDAGARWRIGGGIWQVSGYTEALEVGQYTVEFSDLSGWTKPANQTVTVTKGQTTIVSGTFTSSGAETGPGSVQVTIIPQAAVDAGARWRIDEGSWYASGYTETGLTVGLHTVELSDLTGWRKSISRFVMISNSETVSMKGSYVQNAGSITVTIDPQEAIEAGAKWRVDGGIWQAYGDTQTGLSPGQHTVEFSDLSSWTKPANQTVTINDGQTAVASGTYLRRSAGGWGSLGGGGTANSNTDGGPPQISGFAQTGLSAGQHSVESSNTGGRTLNNPTAAGNTPQRANTNENSVPKPAPPTGSIAPQGAPQGTPQGSGSTSILWRVDGGPWQTTKYTQAVLSADWHMIEFTNIAMLAQRENPTGMSSDPQTASTPAPPVQETGSLTVTVTPQQVIDAGARWRVDRGPWQPSGYTQTGLSVGQHLVEFSDVTGWTKPSNWRAIIGSGQATTLTRAYAGQTGSLVVTLDPLEAVRGGARWRVDEGPWQTSEYTQTGLSAGPHTVEFSDVAGWTKPANQTVRINSFQTTMTVGTFVKAP